ncbi:MAG: STAS domain-containing protein [Leptospira sp.]|nr:STAS domain-containing protein [Leptospira sp.]
MEYTESKIDGIIVLKLFGNLDMLNAGILKERIRESTANKEHKFIFDLGGVNFVDSSGFGLIMSLNDKLADIGGGLRIVNVSKTIRQIFRISKIASVIQIYETTDEALKSF